MLTNADWEQTPDFDNSFYAIEAKLFDTFEAMLNFSVKTDGDQNLDTTPFVSTPASSAATDTVLTDSIISSPSHRSPNRSHRRRQSHQLDKAQGGCHFDQGSSGSSTSTGNAIYQPSSGSTGHGTSHAMQSCTTFQKPSAHSLNSRALLHRSRSQEPKEPVNGLEYDLRDSKETGQERNVECAAGFCVGPGRCYPATDGVVWKAEFDVPPLVVKSLIDTHTNRCPYSFCIFVNKTQTFICTFNQHNTITA